jgi:serine protease Do
MGASRIKITTLEGKEFTAEVVGAVSSQDLALLKIEGEGSFPYTPIGNPGELMIGETVIAIGNPFGLTNTVTTGVVSALKRSIRLGDKVYSDFVQTDASINPGNSGGPLLNINGELIGINTAIIGGEAEGIGFAIPIERVAKIVADLRTYGEVQTAWIGIRAEALSDEERQYIRGMSQETRGILVTTLYPDSPASAAGLKAGDIILQAEGRDISSNTDFRTIMSGKSPGDYVTLNLLRAGRRLTKKLRAGEIPDLFVDYLLESAIGIEISSITTALRRRYRQLPKEGALIIGVLRGSEAERIGIEPADVIRSIQNVQIRNDEEMRKALKTFWDRGEILCVIQRGRVRYRVPIALR